MSTRHEVCPADALPPGERQIVDASGVSVGVFNLDGEYYALHNRCPHQGAPLAAGQLTALTTADGVGEYRRERDGEILRCPWHGWEFDVTDGRSVFDPQQVRTATFETGVEPPAGKGDSACEACPDAVETFDATVEDEVVVVYV